MCIFFAYFAILRSNCFAVPSISRHLFSYHQINNSWVVKDTKQNCNFPIVKRTIRARCLLPFDTDQSIFEFISSLHYVEYFRLFKCSILYFYQMVFMYNFDLRNTSSTTSKLHLSSHFPPVISSSSWNWYVIPRNGRCPVATGRWHSLLQAIEESDRHKEDNKMLTLVVTKTWQKASTVDHVNRWVTTITPHSRSC